MSMIADERDMFPDVPNCTFCGERKADAMWSTADRYVFVCRWCATTDVLPKLQADAVCNARRVSRGRNLWNDTHDALEKINASFYRAATIDASRILDREAARPSEDVHSGSNSPQPP